MNKILLLLEQKANRRLLTQLLANRYQICLPEGEQPLEQPFDLCIMDGLALEQYRQELQAIREAQQPVFLPILLLSYRQSVGMVTRNLWQDVDDAIATPIEKVELLVKVETLLRSRRLSLELKAANEELQELNALKSRFIAIASHDLRNPLSIISMSADLLENFSAEFSEEQRHQRFELIHNAIGKITDLLDDVLVISRAEQGKLEFNPIPLALTDFCQELAQEFQFSAGDNYTVNFVCQGSPPGHSHGTVLTYMDEKLLRHIFANLLSNAIKYSPKGGTVQFELAYRDDKAIFKVRDSGIGIPPEDLKQLFEAFHRANNVGSIPGTGLGLSIVKQCVDIHGGAIEVDSTVGQGTTFTVTLPLGESISPSELSFSLSRLQ